jgi:cytochrome c biogenesis protein CcdA
MHVEQLSNFAFNFYLRRCTKAKSDALTVNGLAFAAGLASTLALLGVSAAALGKVERSKMKPILPF